MRGWVCPKATGSLDQRLGLVGRGVGSDNFFSVINKMRETEKTPDGEYVLLVSRHEFRDSVVFRHMAGYDTLLCSGSVGTDDVLDEM